MDFKAERAAHAQPVEIRIMTKVPSKWVFIDMETNHQWAWDEESGRFKPFDGRWYLAK